MRLENVLGAPGLTAADMGVLWASYVSGLWVLLVNILWNFWLYWRIVL